MIAAKQASLDEIVGQLKEEKEEEPEGEVLGDSDTGSLLYFSLLLINFTDPKPYWYSFILPSFPFFQMILKKRREREGPIHRRKKT